jgi:hypothetical protein
MEAVVGAVSGIVLFLTWNHERKQRVIENKFDFIDRRAESLEKKIEQMSINYVLKSDLDTRMHDIQSWLRSINDKLDKLILLEKD